MAKPMYSEKRGEKDGLIETVQLVHGDFVREYKVEDFPLLNHVLAMIETESQWNEKADSGFQRGLMQVQPAALETINNLYGTTYSYDDMFDPAKNVFVGIRYMRWLYRYFCKHVRAELQVPLQIMQYNWGVGNVMKWLKQTEKSNSVIDESVPNETKQHWLDWLFWSVVWAVNL